MVLSISNNQSFHHACMHMSFNLKDIIRHFVNPITVICVSDLQIYMHKYGTCNGKVYYGIEVHLHDTFQMRFHPCCMNLVG